MPYFNPMINLIMKLISFNTTQHENAAMQFIEQYVQEKYGDKVICVHQAIWDNDRYNLIIKNTEQPDIILAGHVDTVPELSKEQFIPKIEGNKLYGRWAVDMKAGVAINIQLIDFMLKNTIKFFVLCYADEEYNFLWMKKFTEVYAGKIFPKLTIVTEPTDTAIYTGFRWIAALSMEIKWKSVHSARKHLGINAIESYVHFIEALEQYMQTKDIEGYQSLTNLAWMSWWIYKDNEIMWQDNIVPCVAKGKFSLRLGNNFTYEDFSWFMKTYFAETWIELIEIEQKIWYNPLIQVGLEAKYAKYGTVENGATFGYSDIQLVKEHLGGDCLLIWPWPRQLAHQAEEYVDIDSIEQAKNIIENILKDVISTS